MKIIFNYCMNREVRMLDGQWQGVCLASDRRVYFFGGSHYPGVSAPFFRYTPEDRGAGRVELIARNLSEVCGEDITKVAPQGKVHSEVVEHQGWLYFGTHLGDYTPSGRQRYPGAHLLGYELATGHFRDFGVIHRNFSNYAGLALDAPRAKIYFYVTPFVPEDTDGPHLHRIDIRSGANEDLGLLAPWVTRINHQSQEITGLDHERGQACYYMFVDGQGDCWLTLDGERTLFVARALTGKIERYPAALPASPGWWYCACPLDGRRCLITLDDGIWLFDASRFGTPGAFTRLMAPDTPGFSWARLAYANGRMYWACRQDDDRHRTENPEMHLNSAPLADPQNITHHGIIRDQDGRAPRGIASLVPDGQGRIYLAGRWHVLPEEYKTLGVDRHGHIVAAFFTVLDVADDLAAEKPAKND